MDEDSLLGVHEDKEGCFTWARERKDNWTCIRWNEGSCANHVNNSTHRDWGPVGHERGQ